MGRRSGIGGVLNALSQAAAHAEREQRRAIRAMEAHNRRVEADLRRVEKQAKMQHQEDQQYEVEYRNSELQRLIGDLQNVLAYTLSVDDRIDFKTLKTHKKFESFVTPVGLVPGKAPLAETVPDLTFWQKLIPGAGKRHQDRVAENVANHQTALSQFGQVETVKRRELAVLQEKHAREKSAFDAEQARQNDEIDQFEAAYYGRQGEAVISYCEMVLDRSNYLDLGFPQEFMVGYNEQSRELIVEYRLPEISVVPADAEFRYIKTRDAIEAKPRKATEIRQLYQDVVASITLRTLHELFEADVADALVTVTFNGYLDTTDPASGHDVRLTVMSVRVGKDEFVPLKLDRVDRATCLRNLGAHVSARPDELQAIKPIIEFNMVDSRFVEQGQTLANLDSQVNLLDLNPWQFEDLVSNLFTKMGLDTKLTRSSRDGGVDAVAYDTRPIVGGKVVIQAKRYKDTVGVSAVRDLYGTMQHEGANKGILVCTSGYGPDAYTFAKDKPIELINGSGLIYLLREHAGIQARIVVQ